MLVFKKERMVERITREGKAGMLDKPSLALMDSLDGLEAFPNRWRQTVYGEDDAYYCVLGDKQIPVNRVDCVNE